MAASNLELAERLAIAVTRCKHDPERFVDIAYPWGEPGPLQHEQPRTWQRSVARHIAQRLQNAATRFQPILIAIASGHGIGKTAFIAWIIDWGMSTFVDCRAVVTANTDGQLKSKTWPEVIKWRGMSLTADWFTTTATKMVANDSLHEANWRADALPWSEHNAVAFQGMHNKRKRVLILMDEGSEIPKAIWDAVRGYLTDEETEIIWIVFANPTRNSGEFYGCFSGPQRHRWSTLHIDSRDVEGTNKTLLNQWVQDYGEDSDFVRVRVRGLFPRSGDQQLIPNDVIEAAAVRQVLQDPGAPVLLGVDVARMGDNQSVIVLRNGRDGRSWPARKFRGIRTTQLAGEIIRAINDTDPDAVFIDGGGVGGGVIDILRESRFKPLIREVLAGSSPLDERRYLNKRAEMWGEMAQWLTTSAIANDQQLQDDLRGPRRYWKGERMFLESKADMVARGVASPDWADALAHTFAAPVARKDMKFMRNLQERTGRPTSAQFDPYEV